MKPENNKSSAFILGLFVFLGLAVLGYLLADAAIRYKEYERLRNMAEIETTMTVFADEACLAGDTKIATPHGFKTIKELAETIKETVGYEGEIVYDASKPDGTPRKLVDTARINGLGWQAGISLQEGIKNTYQWFLQNEA